MTQGVAQDQDRDVEHQGMRICKGRLSWGSGASVDGSAYLIARERGMGRVEGWDGTLKRHVDRLGMVV